MLGKKYGPAVALPIMMFCFGSFTLCTAGAQNFSGVMALRWFLGMNALDLHIDQSNKVKAWLRVLSSPWSSTI